MKIKFSTWRRFCIVASIVVAPLVLLNFFRPAWWHKTEQNISFAVMISGGLAGALMAILQRVGKVEFIYSEKDKEKTEYKMSKFVAEQERQNSSVKDLYSEKYYQSFEETKSGEPNNKSSSEK